MPNAVFAELRSEAPWSTSSSSPAAPPKTRLRTALVAFAASVIVTVTVLLLVLPPKQGGIFVSATGPSNAAIAKAEVLVDGRPACSTIPCRVDGIPHGSHLVRVRATGYEPTADQALAVQPGEESLIHFNLAGEASAGIDVRVGTASGLRVILDGAERGPAPLVLHRLSPGPHTLRLTGNPLYAVYEQELRLLPHAIARVEPTLVPLKGVIHLAPGVASLGAWVEVVGGGARHVIRKLPARIEVAPETSYRLRATRIGYRDYETKISFSDAQLEKRIRIDFVWAGAAGTPVEASQGVLEAGSDSESESAPKSEAPAEPEPKSEPELKSEDPAPKSDPAPEPESAPAPSLPEGAESGTVGTNSKSFNAGVRSEPPGAAALRF